MIKQLGFPTFFVIFTYTKRLWDPFIKALHIVDASRLNLPNKIEDLQSFHILELIHVQDIMIIKHFLSANL
jgi:hypothetical protein